MFKTINSKSSYFVLCLYMVCTSIRVCFSISLYPFNFKDFSILGHIIISLMILVSWKLNFRIRKTHTGSGNKINQLKEITNFNNESLHEFYKSALFPCNVPATIRSDSIRVHFFHVNVSCNDPLKLERYSGLFFSVAWAPIGARVSSLHSTFPILVPILTRRSGKKIVKRSLFFRSFWQPKSFGTLGALLGNIWTIFLTQKTNLLSERFVLCFFPKHSQASLKFLMLSLGALPGCGEESGFDGSTPSWTSTRRSLKIFVLGGRKCWSNILTDLKDIT